MALMSEGLEHEIGQDRTYAYLSGEVWYSSRAWGRGGQDITWMLPERVLRLRYSFMSFLS